MVSKCKDSGTKKSPGPPIPLGWGGNAAIRLPWFTGVVPGEIVALPGQIVLEETIAEDAILSRQLFCLDPALTRGRHWVAPLVPAETNSGIPNLPRPGQNVMLVALMLDTGALQPILWLPSPEPRQIFLGWNTGVVLIEANVHLMKRICDLKLLIRQNLLEIFSLFGVPAPSEALDGEIDRFHYGHVLVLELARQKKQLDQKTIRAGLAALRQCLEKIKDDDKRVDLTTKLNTLDDAMQTKSFFETSIFAPLFGDTFNPRDDNGEFSGFPYWDRAIIDCVVASLGRLEEYLEEFITLKRRMTGLVEGAEGAAAESPAPSAADLRERLSRMEREFSRRQAEFGRAQAENEARLLERIEDACSDGDLGSIVREIIGLLDGLFERNLRFLEIARDLAEKERILTRRGRRLAAAIQGLLDTEKAIIDRAVEAEREALVGESSDQEIRVRKLNVLLQFQQAVNEQLERMMCGSGTVALVFDRAPDTLEGMLEGKEDEAARILEWLKDREDKLEEGRSAVRGLVG